MHSGCGLVQELRLVFEFIRDHLGVYFCVLVGPYVAYSSVLTPSHLNCAQVLQTNYLKLE